MLKRTATVIRVSFYISVTILLTTCTKDTDIWFSSTGDNITDSLTTTLRGSLIREGKVSSAEYGICYSANGVPTINDNIMNAGIATSLVDYSAELTCLPPATYNYCSYVKEASRVQYGEVNTFTVEPSIIVNSDLMFVKQTASECELLVGSNVPVSITSDQPWAVPDKLSMETGWPQTLKVAVANNTDNTIRVAVLTVNGGGIKKTLSIIQGNGIPSITTSQVRSITGTTAVCGGVITDDGGANITAKGVCWSTSSNPTIADNHTTDGNSASSFTSNITGLTSGLTYYVRAYVINGNGVFYGNEISFVSIFLDYSNYYSISSSQRSQVFYDEFTDNSNSWDTLGTNPIKEISYGEYHLSYNSPGYFDCSVKTISSFMPNENFEITVRLIKSYDPNSEKTSFVGLVWGNSSLERHFDLYTDLGKYYTGSISNNIWSKWSGFTMSSSINTYKTYNILTVRKVNNVYYFFINYTWVYSYSADLLWPADQMVGFSFSDCSARIDYIYVHKLNL